MPKIPNSRSWSGAYSPRSCALENPAVSVILETKFMVNVSGMQQVPQSYTERQRIRSLVETLPLEGLPTRNQLEKWAKSILDNENLHAWTMVLIGSKLWKRQVENVPISQRLLLLPHCLRNTDQCPADYDA